MDAAGVFIPWCIEVGVWLERWVVAIVESWEASSSCEGASGNGEPSMCAARWPDGRYMHAVQCGDGGCIAVRHRNQQQSCWHSRPDFCLLGITD